MYLTAEQKEIGKLNFLTALGQIRGDFLRKSLEAPAIGPYYFGYSKVDKPVKAGIVGTGNEGCEAMIQQSPPGALEFVAYHDIRPSQIERAPKYFEKLYGAEQGKKVKFHAKWEDMLADKDIEAIVIATPLWTHAKLTIDALNAGKHVLCEKLMAHNITEAKAMVKAADKSKKVLSVGHQRHYSTLYDNALAVVHSGILGEIKHIQALWHRNNTWTKPDGTSGDGWYPEIPENDKSIPVQSYGYKSVEELVRWRLFNRTGGGLMAELGSHQLDACSLFLHKEHPVSVTSTGGKYYFKDDRECEDHVYCTFLMPKGVVVTYSSINTNAHDGYGEIVMGTKGTLLVLKEADVMLFKEREPGDKNLSVESRVTIKPGPVLGSTTNPALTDPAALAKVAIEKASKFTPNGAPAPMVNRGYREEMEAFAHAIRNPGTEVRCSGRVALADAVMALTANVAMRQRDKIDFQASWYDPAAEAVPDGKSSTPLAKNA